MLTDDIILMRDGITYPILRTPKFRRPADEMLKSIGFDLPEHVDLMKNYVLLREKHLQRTPIQLPIKRIFILTRHPDQAPVTKKLSLTDGVLAMLPSSNLLAISSSMDDVFDYFSDTQFIKKNLSNYAADLRDIAE
jgi:hypothetical protein